MIGSIRVGRITVIVSTVMVTMMVRIAVTVRVSVVGVSVVATKEGAGFSISCGISVGVS